MSLVSPSIKTENLKKRNKDLAYPPEDSSDKVEDSKCGSNQPM